MLELKRQTFRQSSQKSRAFTQITLDDDCIVKDNKPDLLKIIHTRGTIVFEDVKVSSQTVRVTGQLRFVVLYRSEDNRLESFTDSISFTEKMFMDDVEETDSVHLTGQLEDLNISMINSRKLAVRALLGIQAVCDKSVEEEVACAVEGEETVQQKSNPHQLLALAVTRKDLMRVHSDIPLPQSSPNIGRILYENADVRNREILCNGENIQIQGEAHIAVLYSSLEGKLEWYETTVPFSEMLEGAQMQSQPVSWVSCRLAEHELEPAEDYDGEMRAFGLNLVFDVNIRLWEEKTLEVLEDVYALDANLVPQRENVCIWKLLVKNEAKLRVAQQMKLADGQEKILQLCASEGNVDIDHVELMENGMQVEGILTVHILYATTDDNFPIAHTQEQVPFTQVIDVQGLHAQQPGISYELEPSVDQLAVNLLDNERFEIKAVISLSALVLQEDCFEKIVEIIKEPLDAIELMQQPGMTGYVVQKGEQLWDIARRFHTTEKQIMETNGRSQQAVQEGEKLLIVKKVCEC